jgi:hypothetical protein
MRAPRPPGPLLAVLLLTVLAARGAAPQLPPHIGPSRVHERYATDTNVSRYASLYGSPEARGIDDDGARPWPHFQSIRTVGNLSSVSEPTGGAAGRTFEYRNKYVTHLLCGARHCVGVKPVPEMRDFFGTVGPTLFHRSVEVIGAVEDVGKPGDSECPCYAFLVWSVEPCVERGERQRREGASLETLVRVPEAAAGRRITVSGVFRGANLFEDLPPETRRSPADWVLKDGPFSIWVTGRAPKGSGFFLDLRSRSDCTWRVEVQGKVETAGEYVYLRAKRVVLMGREKEETAE